MKTSSLLAAGSLFLPTACGMFRPSHTRHRVPVGLRGAPSSYVPRPVRSMYFVLGGSYFPYMHHVSPPPQRSSQRSMVPTAPLAQAHDTSRPPASPCASLQALHRVMVDKTRLEAEHLLLVAV